MNIIMGICKALEFLTMIAVIQTVVPIITVVGFAMLITILIRRNNGNIYNDIKGRISHRRGGQKDGRQIR